MAQLTLTQMGYLTNSSNGYLDFVMDFNTMSARFVNLTPSKNHKLIASIKMKNKMTRSWRVWKIGDEGDVWSPKIVKLGRAHSLSVLKSNLQKAVRMCNTEEAVRTAIEMLAIDRMELFRRLPIISIEDASLIENTMVIVWLMMASERGPMLKKVAEFVYRYVVSLCHCRTYYPNRFMNIDISHPLLVSGEYGSDIASLRIRESYGGMKGDILMLNNAVAYYHNNPEKVYPLSKKEVVLPETIDFDHIVLPESIDFHPCPWILRKLAEKTELKESSIKHIIWVGDSAANIRKSWTLERQKVMKKDKDYIMISYHLMMIRSRVEKSRYKVTF